MSSQPTGWQTPKTNWQSADVPLPTDFNRIEGNIQAIESGSRTLDPSQVPTGNTGSLRQLLDWFANRIRAISGEANWYDGVGQSLKAHRDATSAHGATSSATANRLVIRDSAGRAQFATPSAAADAATKGYVDDTVNSHANATSVHGATSSATANRLVIRDGSGRAQFAAPSASGDAATKGYVDALLGVPMVAGNNFVVQVVDTEQQSGSTIYPDWRDSIRNMERRDNNVAVRILLPGTVRCALEHYAALGKATSYVRILKNGSVVQEWSTTSETFVARSVDVDVSPGDVITFQQRTSSGSYPTRWRNLRVMTAAPTLGIQKII